MADADLPMEGGCRCGQLRFRMSAAPVLTAACHCRGCQRMTGGGFALAAMVMADAFEVTAGEPVVGGLKGEVHHFHCPSCMSWVFTRPPGVPMVNIRTPMLDQPDAFAPYIDMWVSEKLPWVEVTSGRAYAQFPEMGEWPGLMKGYAEG